MDIFDRRIVSGSFGASGDALDTRYKDFNILNWYSLIYVLFCTTFLTYLFDVYTLSRLMPSTVSIYVSPTFDCRITLLGTVFLNEVLHWLVAFAGSLIFTGVYLVSKK